MWSGRNFKVLMEAIERINQTSLYRVWLVLLYLLSCGATAFAQTPNQLGWTPAKTRVFFIDVLLYEGESAPPASWLEIPSSAFVDQFRELGVPANQIMLLTKQQATAQNVSNQFAAFLRQSRPGEMLIFAFSGHSGRNILSMHDRSLQKTWLIDAIETNFRGSHALLFIDSCYSGGVVDLIDRRRSRISYGALSSTFSQQSASSGCRFYQSLLRGFGGNPVVDLDKDGYVTFGELAWYTKRYMAHAAEGKPMFATSGAFDLNMRLTVAKGQAPDRVGELVEVRWKGKWYRAEILAVTPDGFKIHYTKNTKSDEDEVVSADDVRVPQFPRYKVGHRVEVKSGTDGKWHPATVLATFESLHGCRVDGLPPTKDEWFGPSRIRPISTSLGRPNP
ncbi:MAG: agenet domain-containing protein [Armatimonadota bacterium]